MMEGDRYRTLISDFIRERMIEEGYRRITLEEITQHLAISKKTIYRVFSSKEALSSSILMNELSHVYEELILIIQEKSTMIEKVEKLSEVIKKYIQLFNEDSLQNLKKEFPNLWREIICFRKERVLSLFNHLLDHSKKIHLITDYPNELIIKLFSTSLTISTEKKYLINNKTDYQSVFQSVFDILLGGLLTRKGKKLLAINKRMRNENN